MCAENPRALCRAQGGVTDQAGASLAASQITTMPSFLKNPFVLLGIGVVLGAAYGRKLPLVPTIASNLPGSTVL
jgi:hypothetical protein